MIKKKTIYKYLHNFSQKALVSVADCCIIEFKMKNWV